MYALCPECNASQTITPKQLQKKQGRITCSVCGHRFDALSSLSDTPHQPELPVIEDFFSWQKETKSRSSLWTIVSFCGLLLLVYQVHYFVAYPLAQNPKIRPWLSLIYDLPAYRNVSEYTVVGSSLKRMQDSHYRLQVSLINHADYAQAAPSIELTLQDRYGANFARRLFKATEYQAQQKEIAANESLDIELFIAASETKIAGYQIDLY